ncbi:MAG: hypothetical protein SFU25_05530, partial [Candidatus Caenarcaniphilales bacterium]|nr:hypothetical protein [Candidatus Caenarcaniphilales bacterium]
SSKSSSGKSTKSLSKTSSKNSVKAKAPIKSTNSSKAKSIVSKIASKVISKSISKAPIKASTAKNKTKSIKDIKTFKIIENKKPLSTTEVKVKAPKKTNDQKKTQEPEIIIENTPSKRGRKKKTIELLKTKITAKGKPGRKSRLDEDEDEFIDDLAADDSFEDDSDLKFDSDLIGTIEVPIKRRPGRPPKNKDLVSGKAGINFPGSTLRLPKKEPFKLKKKLSDTLPGTSLASLISGDSSAVFKEKQNRVIAKEPDAIQIIDPISQESEDDLSTLPSWTPRSWVTREGERLIIRGSELVKEEQFGNLQDVTNHGVISPDQVDEVIRRIRESYKKKPVVKKGE